MTMTALYPITAASAAMPMPVLPLVGSTMTAPGFSRPRCSASSSMAQAMRSFTLPAGLKYSTLASRFAFRPRAAAKRCSCTSGVWPTSSEMLE